MNKPNRAHYRVETHILTGKWEPTERVVCVFHGRRVNIGGYRLIVLRVGKRGMSRPIEQDCTDCLSDRHHCEHDIQGVPCSKITGDTCGRDSDKELGGSW